MKKVNYKSFKSVNNRIDEIFKDGRIILYKPLENGLKDEKYIFNPKYRYFDSEEILKEALLGGDMKESKVSKSGLSYNLVYKDLKTRISEKKPHKPYIKNQIISFMKLLANNPDEALFVGNLFVSIYETEDFKSKENPEKFATDEEKKKLLDIPLKILKANKNIQTFRRGFLYSLLFPEIYQEVLFNESDTLLVLINDDNFQHSKRNIPELEDFYIEHVKNKVR